jgi:hypothetical protein
MILRTKLKNSHRRAFLARSTTGLALLSGALLRRDLWRGGNEQSSSSPKAHCHRSICAQGQAGDLSLQSGAPSHIDLFDPKPKLTQMTGEELPPSVRMGQRSRG